MSFKEIDEKVLLMLVKTSLDFNTSITSLLAQILNGPKPSNPKVVHREIMRLHNYYNKRIVETAKLLEPDQTEVS